MTDERDTPASTPARKRRASRKRPESAVDRKALARVVNDRMTELFRDKGVTQAEVARRAECGVSTLRHMQNGTGTSHYGHELLTRVAMVLGLPADQLVKTFYLPVPRDPAPPSDAEVAAQLVMNQLEPYLAKIPGMQTDISGMKKDVEGMRERLQGVAHDIQQVKSQVEILLEIDHPPAAGER